MCNQTCDRCQANEYIPTHQYIRTSDGHFQVCRHCYDELQGWIKKRSSLRISKFVPLS
ncbi:MAG: hypothetical protein HUU29_08050 [Planctomycetaceae bacterium]|nr:hypothetical protein [Planctomycetaceae bacterium]